MKTIEHVEPGQNIKASTINGLIDAVYGDSYTGVGHYRTTTNGVAIEPGVPLSYTDLGIGPDAWKVDPMTLKVTNAWFTLGEKSYGACLTKQEETIDGKDTIDYFHMIDFGKEAIEKGEFQGDYYIRISNSFVDDPESTQTQEDDDEELFNDFYDENMDEDNKVHHYYEIQVVKDKRKNGDDSSLEDDHGVDPEDCVYFKFFTIYGPHDGEKDEEGKQAKTLPPYDIHYYTRSFGGGFGEKDLRPWKLRWLSKGENDTDGEWQVYLPIGCATINKTDIYYPANDVGETKDGAVTYQWYTIEDPQAADADVTTKKGYTYTTWTVYALLMDYPLMKVTTKKDDSEFKTKTAIPIGSLLQKQWDDEDTGKRHTSHTTSQTLYENYNREFDNSGAFRIYYKCEGDKKSSSSYSIMLTNQFIKVGRNQIWIEDDTDITDYEDVVLKIDHSKEEMTIEVVDTLEKNSLDYTNIRILRLDEKTVVDDLREQVRREFDFYTN